MEPLNEFQPLPMMKQVETWLLSDEEEMGMVSFVSDRVKDYETWLLSDEEEMGMVSVVSDRVKDYETWLLEDEEKIPNKFPLDALKDSYVSNAEPAWLLRSEEELPVGYRFKPTNRDLLIHYLGKRLTGGILRSKAVMDFNVYSKEPWLLPGSDMIRSDVKASLYFFVAYPKTSEKSSRAHRQAGNGFWKASTGDKEIRDDSLHHMRVIGYVKQLTYHLFVDDKDRSTNRALKTHWIMHEFKLTKVVSRDDDLQDKDALNIVFKVRGPTE